MYIVVFLVGVIGVITFNTVFWKFGLTFCGKKCSLALHLVEMDKVSDPDQQALDADPDTENDAVMTESGHEGSKLLEK